MRASMQRTRKKNRDLAMRQVCQWLQGCGALWWEPGKDVRHRASVRVLGECEHARHTTSEWASTYMDKICEQVCCAYMDKICEQVCERIYGQNMWASILHIYGQHMWASMLRIYGRNMRASVQAHVWAKCASKYASVCETRVNRQNVWASTWAHLNENGKW